MRQLNAMCAAGMLLFSAAVSAHTHLATSVPAHNAELAIAPEKISLSFKDSVQLTAVAVESGDTKKHALTPLPAGKVKDVTLTAPKLDAGVHTVLWRAVGEDGHVMSGKVRFTIKAE
jgi:methionine-rich copper-binding protein CopC